MLEVFKSSCYYYIQELDTKYQKKKKTVKTIHNDCCLVIHYYMAILANALEILTQTLLQSFNILSLLNMYVLN